MLWPRSQRNSTIVRPIRTHSNVRVVHCRPARRPLEGLASLIRIGASIMRPPVCGLRPNALATFAKRFFHRSSNQGPFKQARRPLEAARPPLEGRASLIRICASFIRPPARCKPNALATAANRLFHQTADQTPFKRARLPLQAGAAPTRRPRVAH